MILSNRQTLLSAIVLTMALLTGCQVSTSKQVHQILARAGEAKTLHGAALIMQGDAVLYEGAIGVANREQGVPNSIDTKFRLASLTKLFTQAATLRLVDQGRIDLDATLSTYRPVFQKSLGERITIRQIYAMTAGLPRELDEDMSKSGVRFDEVGMAGPYLDQVEAIRLIAEPEEAVYNYSNVGYWVLGSVIEAVTGQTYAEAVDDLVFNPLKMNSSGFEQGESDRMSIAVGYKQEQEGALVVVDPVNVRARYASGGGYSTVGDLRAFCHAFNDNAFLSAESKAMMLNGVAATSDDTPKNELNVGGVLPGFTNRLIYQADEGLLVLLLNNLTINPPSRLLSVTDELWAALGGTVAPKKKRTYQSVPKFGYPETPLAQAMKAFMEAIMTEDAAHIEAVFRGMIIGNEFTEKELVELGENMAALPQQMGKFEVAGYREESPLEFEVVVFGEGEGKVFFTFGATEEQPDLVKDLRIFLDDIEDK